MFVAQDNPTVLRLYEVERVYLADGFGSGGNGDKTELPCGAENCMPIGRIERLNFVQEKRHGAVIAPQLVFQQKQIEQHFEGDSRAMRLDLPEIVISVPLVVRAYHCETKYEQVRETNHRIVLNLATEVGNGGLLLRVGIK